MPIRHFDHYIVERQLIQTSPISELNNTRLGIDGNNWLKKIIQTTSKEPGIVAMGGSPLTLDQSIQNELNMFKKHNITPFFVFSGISTASLLRSKKKGPFTVEDLRPVKREKAWEEYEKGNSSTAWKGWSNSGSMNSSIVTNQALEILVKYNAQVFRSPYSNWGQLSYFLNHEKQIVHAIYGGSEVLLFDVDTLILNIDFQAKSFTWLSKKAILSDLKVNEDQFVDICIFAGFEWSSTFPPLTQPIVDVGNGAVVGTFITFTFKATVDMIKQFRSGFQAATVHADHPEVIKQNYIDSFCRTKCTIKYHLVLTDEGVVEPLNSEEAPNDIHEFAGPRFPDELYYYMCVGLFSPQSVNTIAAGVLYETHPVCNGDTQEYHKVLKNLCTPIRGEAIYLISKQCNQFFHNRKVITMFWFEPTMEYSTYTSKTLDDLGSSFYLRFNSEWILEQCKTLKCTPDMLFCTKLLNSKVPLKAAPGDHVYSDVNSVLAISIFRFLLLRRFITPQKSLTCYGTALLQSTSDSVPAIKNLLPEDKSENFQEELYLLLEIFRSGSGIMGSAEYDREGRNIEKVEKSLHPIGHIRLISRVSSLLSMHFTGIPWEGPVSRDLLCCNSMVKALGKSLRNLIESISLTILLREECNRDSLNLVELWSMLPLAHEPNTALGIVMNHFLKKISSNSNMQAKELKEYLEKMFPSCANTIRDIKRGLRLWKKLIIALRFLSKDKDQVKELADEKVQNSFQEAFAADEWLNQTKYQQYI